jgi:hypothetical protein
MITTTATSDASRGWENCSIEHAASLGSVKGLFTIAASGTALTSVLVLAIVPVLMVFVIPGVLGILTIECERAGGWLRRTGARWLRPRQTRTEC